MAPTTGKPSTLAHAVLLIALAVLLAAVVAAGQNDTPNGETNPNGENPTQPIESAPGANCDVSPYIAVCEKAAIQDSQDAKLDRVCCKTILAEGLGCQCNLRRVLVRHGYVDNRDGVQAISCVPDATSCS